MSTMLTLVTVLPTWLASMQAYKAILKTKDKKAIINGFDTLLASSSEGEDEARHTQQEDWMTTA